VGEAGGVGSILRACGKNERRGLKWKLSFLLKPNQYIRRVKKNVLAMTTAGMEVRRFRARLLGNKRPKGYKTVAPQGMEVESRRS
jgi:hypothetical protein